MAAVKPVSVLCILACVIFLPLVADRCSRSRASTGPNAVSQGAPPPPPLSTGPPALGIPAIAPDAALAGAAGGLATCTADEATAYWNSHPIPALPDVMIAGRPVAHTVTRVRFLTSGVVARMVSSSLGRADDYPVCYVELRGTFGIAEPPSGPGGRDSTLLFHQAMIVLDARTGNILLSGQVPFSSAWVRPASAISGA